MSVEARIWAHQRFPAMMREKSVLMILADRHNEKTGYAWPSHASIGKDACTSNSTVKRAIKGLIEQGLVESRGQFTDDQRGHASNRYYLKGHSKVIPPEGKRFFVSSHFGPDGQYEGPGTDAYITWHKDDDENRTVQSEPTLGSKWSQPGASVY